MKALKSFCCVATLTYLLSACDKQAMVQQPNSPDKISAAQREEARAKLMAKIREFDIIADKSGLNALVVGDEKPHSWIELDAYYQRIDGLSYAEDIKILLKQKAIFGLVKVHGILEKAPIERRQYYADQLLAESRPDPKLLTLFLDNLQASWSPKKTAEVKTRVRDLVTTLMSKNSQNERQLATINESLLTNTSLKWLHSEKQRISKQKQTLIALQNRVSLN